MVDATRHRSADRRIAFVCGVFLLISVSCRHDDHSGKNVGNQRGADGPLVETWSTVPMAFGRALTSEPWGPSIERVSLLPEGVRRSFDAALPGEPLSMADTNGAWQSGDVVGSTNLPRRHLIRARKAREFWIVFYEIGGVARCQIIAAFTTDDKNPGVVWCGAVLDPAITDIKALVSALNNGQVLKNVIR